MGATLGGEAAGGALVCVVLDLEDGAAFDGALAGEVGGEVEEEGADAAWRAQARERGDDPLEDFFAIVGGWWAPSSAVRVARVGWLRRASRTQ